MSQVSQTISSAYGGRIELNQKDSLNLTFTDVTTGTLVMKTPGMGIIYRPIKSGVAIFESDCLLEVGIYNVDLIVADVVKTSFEVYAELHTVTQGVDITIDKDMLKDALKEMDLNKEENFVTTSPVTNPIGKIYKGYSKAEAAGFVNLKGHRTVGGMRASIYNAMPKEGVEKLVEFMKKFEAENA